MNQTQIQLRVMEENYENNVLKNLNKQLANKQKDLNQLKIDSQQMEAKMQQF